MFLGGETGVGLDRTGECGEHLLDRLGDGEVGDVTAFGADQVMMMVIGEVVGQLEAGEFVYRRDAMHDAASLEDRQIAVRRTLGQIAGVDDLGGGERTIGTRQNPDQGSTPRRIALIDVFET